MPKGIYIRTEKHKQSMRGIPKSEEHKTKLRKPKSEEHKKNMSLSRLGKHYSSSTEFKSETTSGSKNPFFNHKHTEKSKKQQSEIKKGKPRSEHQNLKLSENAKINPNYGMRGKCHTPESIELMKEHHKDKHCGELNGMYDMNCEDHWNWQGGISFEDYPREFDRIKSLIRDRDNHICQLCKYKESKNTMFDVHHIDFNKKNNLIYNLITLCKRCHGKANSDKEHFYDWRFRLYCLGEIV